MMQLLKIGVVTAAMLVPSVAMSQVDYPVDSVRIFVPANPGGGTDATARIFAQFFQTHSDASVAIINQPAGGGVVAAQSVVQGAQDGSVLFFFHAALHTANLFGNSPYAWDSFTPLATISEINEVYAVRAALRANKSETIEWLKFTLEGVGERTHGYAFEDTAF